MAERVLPKDKIRVQFPLPALNDKSPVVGNRSEATQETRGFLERRSGDLRRCSLVVKQWFRKPPTAVRFCPSALLIWRNLLYIKENYGKFNRKRR